MENGYIKYGDVILRTLSGTVLGYCVEDENNKKSIRLHGLDNKGKLTPPVEFSRTNLYRASELMNYFPVDDSDIRKIKGVLKSGWYSLPRIIKYKNLGYQKAESGEITGYAGARCFEVRTGQPVKVERIMTDVFSKLPKYRGNISNVVDGLNQYMEWKMKRQVVLAHAIAGSLCGILRRNIILSVVGMSSYGKTTIQKMGASFYAEPDYAGTVLKWSATENALVKRLDGLDGVGVLIDDTQLSKLKTFAPIIYSFENGRSIDRLVNKNELSRQFRWHSAIGITAEKSLLDTFNDAGAVARIIELPILKSDDLFENEVQVKRILELYRGNYGLIGASFARYLIRDYAPEQLAEMVSHEGMLICQVYRKRISENNIVMRHINGDIAIILTAAKLANQYFGFRFQVPLLRSALIEVCVENLRTFEQNKFENVVASRVYVDIVETGRAEFPEYERGGKIIIPSLLMKAILNRFAQQLGVRAGQIKEELCRQKLMNERAGVFCWNHTINGKDVTGYEINIFGEKK